MNKMSNDILLYNMLLKKEYEETHNVEVLEKYVISETIAPIEDYTNAISIIRKNYQYGVSSKLMIVGAEMFEFWPQLGEENDFITVLNCIMPYLPISEQAIVSYLNAVQISRIEEDNYQHNPAYEYHLRTALSKWNQLVKCRERLAELCNAKEALQLITEAIELVDQAAQEETNVNMNPSDYVNIDAYINEFIIGSNVTSEYYQTLISKKETLEQIIENEIR